MQKQLSIAAAVLLPMLAATLAATAAGGARRGAGAVADGAPIATAATAASTQGPREKGLKVTFEPVDHDRRSAEGVHSQRARLLSLAVQRGETPTPMLAPGAFRATFRGVLPLAVRDRYRFQISGQGAVKLEIGGKQVLAGQLRPGKVLETEQGVRLDKGDNLVVCVFESAPLGDAELRVSWSSAEFAWEPIAPELWQWDADDADIAAGERLRHGHQAFVAGRCARCHRPDRSIGESAYGELDLDAPDLRTVGARVHSGFLAEWLLDPRAVRPESSMPRIRFESEQEARDVAVWLSTLGRPAPDPEFTPAEVERGEARFLELGCIACHVPPGQTVDPALALDRIPLSFVPRKWHAAALVQFLLAPREHHASSRMPDFRLEADDAKALAAWLLDERQPPKPAEGNAENGRKVAQRHGCDRCHELDVPQRGVQFRDLRGLQADKGCVVGKGSGPDYGFDDEAKAALQAFLPHVHEATQRRSPLDYAARQVEALRCTHCHGRDGEPSVWARVAAKMSEAEPLPPEQDPVAEGVPALTWVGAKLQPGWMQRFVTGREPSPRPWLHARMPAFPRHGSVIIDGIVREHGYPSQDEPADAPDLQLAAHGARLIKMGEGFGCVQCHANGDAPPVQVFERQGVNFRIAGKRLRKEYYLRWLLDPLRIDPDARMPKYADPKGRTAFTDVLGGDAKKQFEAIWHYFRTLK